MPKTQPSSLVVGAGQHGGKRADHPPPANRRPRARHHAPAGESRAECVHLDLADDLRQWRPPHSVSVAILCAGETRIQECKNNPARSAQVNVEGISQIARNLRSEGTFVIYLSTNQVFDGSVPFALRRTQPARSRNMAARRPKRNGGCATAGAADAIVPIHQDSGPQTALFSAWAEALRRGQTIHPFSDMMFAPVPLSCVTNLLLLIAARRLNGIFQVSGDRDISYEAAARIGAEALAPTRNLCSR